MTEQVPTQTFVVGIDPDAVRRRREVVRVAQRRSAWITLTIGALGTAAALAAVVAFRGAGLWPFALLLAASMVPLLLSTVQALRLNDKRERWCAANEPPPEAMRMSARGLELACDGAGFPVILPWSTVRGFRQEKVFGQFVLSLVLAPGVRAGTAGVRGLDQPALRALVKPSPLLRSAGMYPVSALDQPVHLIDRALGHFSDGQAGVIR